MVAGITFPFIEKIVDPDLNPLLTMVIGLTFVILSIVVRISNTIYLFKDKYLVSAISNIGIITGMILAIVFGSFLSIRLIQLEQFRHNDVKIELVDEP